ncbi:MAG: hypothetical protein ABEH43_05320, partial [Flavobacteriales bacterium]
MGTPKNICGKQSPHSGKGYAGLRVHKDESLNREYLRVEFKKPLKNGVQYSLEFYVSLADRSSHGINQIGAFFSKEEIYQEHKARMKLKPNVSSPKKKVLSDTTEWTKVSGTYNAKGGEEYLVIGYFNSFEQMKTHYFKNDSTIQRLPYQKLQQKANSMENPISNSAYYFIDDINLRAKNEEINWNNGFCQKNKKKKNKNLINNGKFENRTKAEQDPYYAGNYYPVSLAENWSAANIGTPQIEIDQDSNASAGISIYDRKRENKREYFGSQLKEKIDNCSKYFLSMEIEPSQKTCFYSDRIGFAFTDSSSYPINKDIIETVESGRCPIEE